MKTKVFGIVVFMLILVSSFSNVFGIEILGPLDDEWNIEEIEDTALAGQYNSIALDSNDYPHISHYKSGDNYGDLKYAKWTGTEWENTAIDTSEITGLYSSICIDSNDYPHISYYDYSDDNLNYVKWTGTDWDYDTVDYSGDVGRWCSLALDSNGNPHISYRDSTNKDLKYAYKTGSGWTDETVVSTGDVGYFTSIALDSNDYPRISYVGLSSNGTFYLKHIQWTGNSWKYNTLFIDIGTGIIDEGESYGFSSLAIDTDDKSHIAYWRNYDGESNIRYAKQASNPYVFSRVSVDIGNPVQGKLVLDSNNLPHISYCRSLTQKYAHKLGGSTWFISYVSTSASGLSSSIDLDSNGLPCISFWKLGLYYATSTNFPPNVPNVPSGPSSVVQGDTETYCTSGFDPNGDQVQYRFDWGDGTTSDWTSFVNSGETACKSYSWSSGGFFNVKAQSRDEWGASSGWSNSLTVDVFGCDAGGPYKGFKNYHVNFAGSADGGTGSYEYRWDFKNDGTYDTSWSDDNKATDTYTSSGSYTVKLQARESGGRTHTDTSEVTIKNLPVVVDALLTLSGTTLDRAGEHFYKNISFNSNALTYLINLDGSVPGSVNLKDFSGPYDFFVDWYTSKIEIDLYPYDPGSDLMKYSGKVDLDLEAYNNAVKINYGVNFDFEKEPQGDEFTWELYIFINGKVEFPLLRIYSAVGPFPVSAKADLILKAGIGFYINSPTNFNQNIFDSVDGFLGVEAEVCGGLGIVGVASVGLYTNVGGKWKFKAPESGGSIFDSFQASISFGAYAEIFCVGKWKWEWFKAKWPNTIMNDPTNDNSWQFMPRNYDPADWVNNPEGVLINDSFPASHPNIGGNSNDERIMVWTQDDLTITGVGANKGDGREIWYSIWNKNNEEWNNPVQLTNDERIQSNPTITMFENGDALCVFNYLDESASGKTIEEIFEDMEVGYSYWDGSYWTLPQLIVSGGTGVTVDSYPVIKSDGNDAVVVWVCDSDGNVSTVNDKQLYASFWDGSQWSGQRIISNKNIISIPVSLAFKNGQTACAYAVDEDADLLNSFNDQNIYVTTFTDNPSEDNTIQITNTGRNGNPCVNYIFDYPSVSWAKEVEERSNGKLNVSILFKENINSRDQPETVADGITDITSSSLFKTQARDKSNIPLIGWNEGDKICFSRKFSNGWEDKLTLHESYELMDQTGWYHNGSGDAVYAVFVEKDNITSYQSCQLRVAGMGQMLAPEKPTISGPSSGYINDEYEFCTSAIDPTPDDKLWFKWDWGDGNQSEWLSHPNGDPYKSGESCCKKNAWKNAGEYEIKVKAKNNYRESKWSEIFIITITSHPPSDPIINGPNTGRVGVEYTYTFVSGEPEGENIYYYIDWDDGENTGWVGPCKNGEELILNHTWNKRGPFYLKAKAKDINDIESDWRTFEIIIPRSRLKNIFIFSDFLKNMFKNLPIFERVIIRLIRKTHLVKL